MSLGHFASLGAQPDLQLDASPQPLNIIPLSANGCPEELHPLHLGKTSTTNASGTREIMMSSLSEDANIDGMLDITLHHASDIHNICIYGKQDVYAKFSITQTQDAVYSTQPVRGGGKNPVFNQSLQILISKLDAVLKCELWMMSCARNYLEDQLLGFVLVPLCDLMGKGRLTCDYTLTSTELFHTPAGTVCLSLMFYKRDAQPLLPDMVSNVVSKNGMASYEQTVGENGKHENSSKWTAKGDKEALLDYNNIEFPDLQVASENQQLVSMYMKMVSGDDNMDDISSSVDGSQEQNNIKGVIQGHMHAREDQSDPLEKHVHAREVDPKLEFDASSMEGDCEMVLDNGEEEKHKVDGSSNGMSHKVGMIVNGVPPSLIASHNSNVQTRQASASEVDTTRMRGKALNSPVCSSSSQATPSPTSISSGAGISSSDDKTMGTANGRESESSFTADAPTLVSISLDAEVPVVQQQIVDMYMKSMQQFTESLAKMKLPFDMESSTQSSSGCTSEPESAKKGAVASEPVVKDGAHRVFYGSRAFF